MTIGFVLITAETGKVHDIYGHIIKIEEIIEIHPLFGEYDFIIKIDAPDFDILGGIILNKIRNISGIVDTKTLTTIKF